MEDAEKKNHIFTTLLTMHQFHAEGKYYDVQLLVENKLFKCLRPLLAANSQFFETMFSSNFQESNTATDQPITLQEMDATAFEKILEFMYTGEIFVTDTNDAFQLLYLNDFLQLRTILVKKKCIKHLRSRSEEPEPISNAFELLSFAFMKEEFELLEIMSAHVCQHLYHYSTDAQLMEFTFEMLNSLVRFSKSYILPLPGSQNVVMKIIHGWINHDRKGRAKHRCELMKNLNSSNMSNDFLMLLINRLEKIADKVSNVPSDIKSSSSESQTSERELDLNVTNGDARLEGTLKFNIKKISKMAIGKTVYSSSMIISNLSWSIMAQRSDTFLSVDLHCAGLPDYDWNCCAVADFFVVLRGNEKTLVRAFSHRLFSVRQKRRNWGFPEFLEWSDVIDPKKGYVENDSITIIVKVRADLPFVERY